MSYSVVGAAVVSPDKTPNTSVDLVATWSTMKDVLRKTLDEYRFGDGTLRTFFGQRCPMATVQHAVVTHDWLARVAKKMIAAANSAGRPSTKMTAALKTYDAAFAKFKTGAKDSFGGRMPLETCYQWIDATDRFVIDLSAAQWTAFNTGTPSEMLRQALAETPGGGLLTGVYDVSKVLANTSWFAFKHLDAIIKIAAVGVAGLIGYRVYRAKPWEKIIGKGAPTDQI